MTSIPCRICIGLLFLSAMPAKAEVRFQFRDGDQILFLGDSITQNGEYPLYLECNLLQQFPNWKLSFRNAAWNSDRAWLHQRTQDTDMNGDAMLKLSGDEQERLRARMVAHGLARDVLPLKPTVVMIMFGANDVRDGDHALSLHTRSLRQIVIALRDANARVIVLSASPEELDSPWNARHEQFVAAVAELANREEAVFVDVFHPVLQAVREAKKIDPSFAYTRDGVHPHPAGHQMIARSILEGLRLDKAVLSVEPPSLLPKVIEKNKAYFHRWREIEIPALVAGKLNAPETRAQLADADKRIADLEAEIEDLRKSAN